MVTANPWDRAEVWMGGRLLGRVVEIEVSVKRNVAELPQAGGASQVVQVGPSTFAGELTAEASGGAPALLGSSLGEKIRVLGDDIVWEDAEIEEATFRTARSGEMLVDLTLRGGEVTHGGGDLRRMAREEDPPEPEEPLGTLEEVAGW